jgi:hypothetical protein
MPTEGETTLIVDGTLAAASVELIVDPECSSGAPTYGIHRGTKA